MEKKKVENLAEFPPVKQGKDRVMLNLLGFAVLLVLCYFSQTIDNRCFKGGQGGKVNSCFPGNFCYENKNVSAELMCSKRNLQSFSKGCTVIIWGKCALKMHYY